MKNKHKMSVKWSENVLLKFLELYHKNDSLWNNQNDKYKRKQAREDALSSIVEEMQIGGLTTADVKIKIKTIRTMYKKEHSLVCKAKKRGVVYEPKLFWYKRADVFLKNVSNTTATSSKLRLSLHETDDKLIENSIENESFATPPETASTDNTDITQEESFEKTQTVVNPKELKPINAICAPHSRKRKMVTKHDISVTSAANDQLGSQNNKRDIDDEFDIFAKLVAVQLRQMPLYNAILCQEEIQTVIRQQRLQLFSGQSTFQENLSPPFSNDNVTENWSSSVSAHSVITKEEYDDESYPETSDAFHLT